MTSGNQDKFRRALGLHQRGDLEGARKLYRQVLNQEPRHFDSLHLLGLALVQSGDLERGCAYIGKALEVRKDFPEAYYNLGNALLSLNRPEEALACFETAIRLNPRDPLYHFEHGNALKELERPQEALQSYGEATRLAPRFAEAFNNIGVLLKDDGKPEAALAQYDRAILLKPGYAEAHGNRGNALKELERFEDALESFDRAIRLKPDYAEAYSNRGNALAKLERAEEALANHDKALSLKPGYAEGYSNRGNALKQLGRLDEALASYEEALRLRPDYAEAYSNRGSALEELGRLDEALASHDKAVALKPQSAEAWCSRANTLVDFERLDQALESYDRAISIKPTFALARYNKSLLDLRRHNFGDGFENYSLRWQAEKPGARGPASSVPPWSGEKLAGGLLLWAEQGLGDEVFFSSLLSLLDPGEFKVALSADKRLHPLLARSFPDLRLLSREETERSISGPYAAQLPVGDLGRLLAVDAQQIARRRYPYLAANSARRDQLAVVTRSRGADLVCGLSWRSGNKAVGHHRSISLADLAPVLEVDGVDFVNLQYGKVAEEIAQVDQTLGRAVQSVPEVDLFNDIEGLVALIASCDVVITIDNVTAHLAGAIGKPAAVLIPCGRSRHWYWGGENPSLWYPSLNLVYQQALGDWSSAIREASAWLRQRAQTAV